MVDLLDSEAGGVSDDISDSGLHGGVGRCAPHSAPLCASLSSATMAAPVSTLLLPPAAAVILLTWRCVCRR